MVTDDGSRVLMDGNEQGGHVGRPEPNDYYPGSYDYYT
jgi:hypothetical protein